MKIHFSPKLNMHDALKYLLAIFLSFGVIINIFGVKVIIATMIIMYLTQKNTEYNILFCSIPFLLYLMVKCIPILGVEMKNDDFHGVYSYLIGLFGFLFFALLFKPVMKQIIDSNRNVKRRIQQIVYFGYYASTSVSLIYIYSNGRDAYRNGSFSENVFCAPYFFIFYAIAFVFLFWSRLLRNKGSLWKNVLGIIFNLFVVFSYNYLTQLLLTLVGMLVYFIYANRNRKTHWFVVIAVCIILIPMIIMLPSIIRSSAVYFKESGNISYYERLMDLSNLFSGRSGEMIDFDDRMQVFSVSYDSFLNRPLLGIRFDSYNTKAGLGILSIGGHYEWIDDFARYGIIGALLMIIFVIYLIVNCCKQLGWNKSIYLPTVIIFILYGCFNPLLQIGTISALFICGICSLDNSLAYSIIEWDWTIENEN